MDAGIRPVRLPATEIDLGLVQRLEAQAEERRLLRVADTGLDFALAIGRGRGREGPTTADGGPEGQPDGVHRGRVFKARPDTNAFVTRVIEQPKIWLIGLEHDLPVA